MARSSIRSVACVAVVAAFAGVPVASASATTILFVGNSFTYADPAGGPQPYVQTYNPGSVTDLNGTGIGGVPALFKTFTAEAGLNYDVSLETSPGKGLDWHYQNRLATIAQSWDKVVLQSYSTLDAAHPGNPATLIQYSGLLANALHAQNAAVNILLMATWSRADQTYLPTGHWYGKPIDAMEKDVQAGYEKADAASSYIDGVIPVGATWDRAMVEGFADPNPYDGITAGQVDLWAPEGYHGSKFGYYLEALTVFGKVTGLDPRSLGGNEQAAAALGITPDQAVAMQRIAYAQLAAVPEPHAGLLALFGVFGLVALRMRPARRS